MNEALKDWDAYQEKIGYRFNDINLLKKAFIHRSYINETGDEHFESNERMEFLGDAVLEHIVSDLLYHHFPEYSEGELTKKRAQLVCEPSFAFLGRLLKIPEHLQLGRGEELSGGRRKDAIISDSFEAFCAAIYLDGGYDWIEDFFIKNLEEILKLEEIQHVIFKDYKSTVQEYFHKNNDKFRYKVEKQEGPDHHKTFIVGLYVNGKKEAQGQGTSKKKAEQDAAHSMLEKLGLGEPGET